MKALQILKDLYLDHNVRYLDETIKEAIVELEALELQKYTLIDQIEQLRKMELEKLSVGK